MLRGDARQLPLPDESVDLIVTSPPYWALRQYTDGAEPLAGQIGSEPDWRDWLEALWDHFDAWTPSPTRPALVVDPFGGTGTTALAARALGRDAVTVDRSADYCRLATWRVNDPGQLAKVLGAPKPPVIADGQASLFEDAS